MIKWRKMRLVGHVALIGEKRNAYTLLVRKPRGDHYEDKDVGQTTR
jgi:hypothetical protein